MIQVPEPFQRIIRAIRDNALARCDRLGISWEAFYNAMLMEHQIDPKSTLPALVKATFARLGVQPSDAT